MATSLFKVSRTAAASLEAPRVAAAPSGGVYFAAPISTGHVQLARIDAGVVTWTKKLSTVASVAYGTASSIRLASSASHVAVALCYEADFARVTAVALFDSDGTLVWQKSLPIDTSEVNGHRAVWMDASSNLYLGAGGVADESDRMLVKLAAADGAVSWVVDTRGTLGLGAPGPLGQMSGGDLVLMTSRSSPTAYVQRRSSSTGAVVWTTGLSVLDDTVGYSSVAVDPDDNVYVIGRGFTGSFVSLPVTKLNSSGALVWSRLVNVPPALASGWTFAWNARAVATAAGVMIPMFIGSTRFGHIFVGTSGTTGTGVVNAITYDLVVSGATDAVSVDDDSGSALVTLRDGTAPTYAVVYKADTTGAGDDGSFGPYTRTTRALDLAAATATITSPGFTAASITAPSASAVTFTDAAGDIEVTVYVPSTNVTATGTAPTVAFGLPELQGLMLPYAVSTVFGAARSGRGQTASALVVTPGFGTARSGVSYTTTGTAFAQSFGTPALSLNTSVLARSVEDVARLGLPYAFRGVAPRPSLPATSLSVSVVFGTPAGVGSAVGTASGFSRTAFGVHGLTTVLAATGLSSTAFGAPSSKIGGRATGIAASPVFGRAQAGGFVVAAGSSFTRVGTPTARTAVTGVATGWSSTQVPSIGSGPVWRTARGARFRQTWGTATTERTCV